MRRKRHKDRDRRREVDKKGGRLFVWPSICLNEALASLAALELRPRRGRVLKCV